jgi:hypothetical protein
MLLSTIFTAFVGLTSAHLKVKEAASQKNGLLTERQAYPYPANTIDMPVSYHLGFLGFATKLLVTD